MNNVKTTLFGVCCILMIVGGVGKALLDGDPATNPDWSVVLAGLMSGFGLIFAKDHNITGGTVPQ